MSILLSAEAIQRMEGLSSIKANDDFVSSAADIYNDLVEEGFEPIEVKQYLINKINSL